MSEPLPIPNRPTLAPEWLAHRYDPGHDAVHFVKAERALRKAVPFLIDANLPLAAEPVVVARADAMAASPAPAPMHFIFHSAYCCSTLLANLFDRPGLASSVKEPTILNDLVGWRHRGGEAGRIMAVLQDALHLLARPFEPEEAVIVKPSNLINGLAPAIMELRPDARCILLHAPLPAYLGSIALKGMWGRLWVRDLLAKQLRDGPLELGFTPEDHLLQTDLQVAAVGWLAQHKLFLRMARRWPDRVRLLDSEMLLRDPNAVLGAVTDHFGIAMTPETIASIVESDAFRRNSKTGQPFRPDERVVGQRQAIDLHADELVKVVSWAEAVAVSAGLDLAASAARLTISEKAAPSS